LRIYNKTKNFHKKDDGSGFMLRRWVAGSFVVFNGVLWGNPQDPIVIHGHADLCLKDKLLEINTSDRAIIHWNGFSIAPDEITRFFQNSSHATVLNRVTGDLKSELLGSLLSNGRVFLINQHGIIVGKDATINTAEFVASTLDVLNEQFLEGEDLLFQGSSDAEIINLGTISTLSGDAALIARRIENRGQIQANGGDVLLGCAAPILSRSELPR
jgi:filamentous hemagglutinin family protein